MTENDLVLNVDHLAEFQAAAIEFPEVAKLWVEDGQLKFEGDVDGAVENLFNLLRGKIDEYVASKLAVLL